MSSAAKLARRRPAHEEAPEARICSFGDAGANIEIEDDRIATCRSGPCTVLSRQSVLSKGRHRTWGRTSCMLAWTVKMRGRSKSVILGAVREDLEDLDAAPDEPAWLITSAAGQTPGMVTVRCEVGDRFCVVADLQAARLTIHQLSKRSQLARKGWQRVLDTDTLHGSIRLCVCLFAGGAVSLSKMHTVEPVSLQSEYEEAVQALEPALGAEDPTTLSAQHNLAQICGARALNASIDDPKAEAALFAEATRMMGLAHAGRAVVLGARHPHTQKSALALSSITQASTIAQLTSIYTEHAPSKLAYVEALTTEWRGREDELLRIVRAKYGLVKNGQSDQQECVSPSLSYRESEYVADSGRCAQGAGGGAGRARRARGGAGGQDGRRRAAASSGG